MRAAIIISLLLHFGYIGQAGYQAYQHAKSWTNLLALRIVDVPSAVRSRSEIEILELRNPLYYPPGLVRPSKEAPAKPEPEMSKKDRSRAEGRDETVSGQPAQPESQPESSAKEVEENVQLLQQGIEQARTLNVGPIREQIVRIYQAQQAGEIRLDQITVAVNFKVREDGAFTHVRLIESSGIPEVDGAALVIVDELNKLRALVALRKTESVTLRLTIGDSVEFSATAASVSIAEAEQTVSELNGLLLAARLIAGSKDARAATLLASLRIAQEGVNVVASVKIPRAEASAMFKGAIKVGS
ncbi:MAG: hypothetical protein HY650_00100 [Acidobacteria bacterium]|nr:hypothetical protein [Acidobacteriota bacterium]